MSLQDLPERLRTSYFAWKGKIDLESLDKLEALRKKLITRVNQVVDSCWEKAKQTEIYEVTVQYSQVDIQSRAILWT